MVFVVASRIFVILAAIAGVEGLALLGYGVFEIVEAARVGATGPAAVSSPAAIALQILIFLLFGAGMVLVARGWLRRSRWVRGPFLVAQFIALVVGVPLAQATGSVERAVGVVVVILGAAGIVLTFTKPVIAVFARRD